MAQAQLNFKKTVAPLTKETQTLSCHFNGTIKQALITCPYGPSYKVEIQVKKGQEPIFPTSGGYFIIDNATVSIPMSEPIERGDVLSVEWINHDNTFSHTIPVVISIISE